MDFDRVKLLLSIQRALIGIVTPSLRMVTVEGDEKRIHLIFFYHGEISDNEYDMYEDAATEIIASFVSQTLELEIIRLDAPAKMPSLKEVAYWRYEP